MSLKSVELQIAIPKTMEASKLHNQLQQKPQQDHLDESLLLQQKKEKDAKRSNEVDSPNKGEIKSKQERLDHRKKKREEQDVDDESKMEKTIKPPHPYKGKTVDISI